jgi:hypothetical protein
LYFARKDNGKYMAKKQKPGCEFYFKTSLLYPLNAKTKDGLVNELRRSIARAKKRTPPLPVNALTR